MIEQRFVQPKCLAAIFRAKHRRGIDSGEHYLGPQRSRRLERPDRVERFAAALGKLDIALSGFIPGITEVVGPTDHRAPMIALVADDDSRLTVANESRRPNR